MTTDNEILAQADAIQTEARKTFNLRDKLLNLKRKEDKVILLTDLEAAERRARLNVELQALADAGKVDEYNLKEIEFDEATEEVLSSAFVVRLRYQHPIVLKKARREARKRFALGDGTIPADRQDDYMDTLYTLIYAEIVYEVVDADGAYLEPINEATMKDFVDLLPPTQYDKLKGTVDNLLFASELEDVSTDDVDF